jgi:imidazole glycerol-phosphate synthase subunit HisF
VPAVRVVARLDIKGPALVKGRSMEGVRRLGDPADFARKYSDDGADELVFIDVVASLYNRSSILPVIEHVSAHVFVPITVVGGLRSVDDMRAAMRAGADKVGINTAAIARPALISEAATAFGSQAVVVSIEAKRRGDGYEAFTDGGREATGRDAVAWAHEAAALGAGEILVTSVDRDGTMQGFDLDLVARIAAGVAVPVVVSGGCASADDAATAARRVDAIAIGAALHGGRVTVAQVKAAMMRDGMRVRPAERAA